MFQVRAFQVCQVCQMCQLKDADKLVGGAGGFYDGMSKVSREREGSMEWLRLVGSSKL